MRQQPLTPCGLHLVFTIVILEDCIGLEVGIPFVDAIKDYSRVSL